MTESLIPAERITRAILVLRGQKVILDQELASLFDVATMRLNEAIKRNARRFPEDFAFQLSEDEYANLKSQIAISSWGGRRKAPWAFTEHGVIMAATVVNSPTAIAASIQVVRAFVRLKQLLASNEELAAKVAAIERRTMLHDADLRRLMETFRRLMDQAQPAAPRRRIGFTPESAPGPDKPKARTRKR